MDIRHGLISADSHVVTERDAFLERMAKSKFGERIPQIKEIENQSAKVERWLVDGKPLRTRGAVNCPAVMGDPNRNLYPQRWEKVPAKAYVPAHRLQALDTDGIDAEVLFPNDPISFHQRNNRDFEIAFVQAYNDSPTALPPASERFISLAMIPLLCGIDTIGDKTFERSEGDNFTIPSGNGTTMSTEQKTQQSYSS